jgi:hypothetical protein
MTEHLPSEEAEAVGGDLEAPIPGLIGARNVAPSPVSFAEQAYLSYLIPYKTNADIEGLIQEAQAGGTVPDSIQQRESLYFGNLIFTRPTHKSEANDGQ